jgi:acetyl esterase/lipase
MSALLLIQTKMPRGWFVLIPRLIAGAFSLYGAIIGIVCAIIGWVFQAFWAVPIGIVGAAMMISYVWQCSRDHDGFEKAFGDDWAARIPLQQTKQMVQKRWTWFLQMKASPETIWERDIPFWTIPGTDRQLLCDVWRPAESNVSGLAFIYYHGGGWAAFDKDFCTRPFFRHLAEQGHTVMDVAYRLCPEVDIYGMIGDVKRAIAWMKANADRFGVDPEKIVLGGGSAGGHLALLGGYTSEHPDLAPEDVNNADLSVCGVISYYGPADLLATYQHENLKEIFGDLPTVPIGTKVDPNERLQYTGRLDILLGGHPEDALHMYHLATPTTHVRPGCPPTLLIQGNKDFVTPVGATCELYKKLVESGVPAINVVFPWTDHAFDLILPQISPPAQSALYNVDRFLALLAN